MSFASVYPLYVQKAEKKGRTRAEVDQVICWLTGYSAKALAERIERKKDFETSFGEAPALHPNARKITGYLWCPDRGDRGSPHAQHPVYGQVKILRQ